MKKKSHPLVKKVLISHKQIQRRSKQLAKEIANFYRQQNVKENTVVVVALLKGAIPFLSEFINHFDYEMEMNYMVVASYFGKSQVEAKPEIKLDMVGDIKDRHVLVIDDVVDSGESLELVKKHLTKKGAQDIRFLTLIDKPKNRKSKIKIDWTGFTIGDEFLIGFGLDYQERLRNLPYVASTNIEKLSNWKWKK